ncbi:hypothetical protein GGE24_000860 [Bradyrhizobium centrosematis]|jgi:hypothetical protein|nr:hypothetical protein [Bradyrhizobium centrosematis]
MPTQQKGRCQRTCLRQPDMLIVPQVSFEPERA